MALLTRLTAILLLILDCLGIDSKIRPRRNRAFLYLVGVCLCLGLLGAVAPQVNASPSSTSLEEYEAKAAFLFNFAKFVYWPETEISAAPTNAPFCIGVIGENPFGPHIQRLEGSTIEGRPVRISFPDTTAAIRECQVLFIAESESARLEDVLARLELFPTLTIGDMEDFAARGGMIEMFLHDNRIRFRINLDAAHAAGLVISSRLLQLAANAEELMRGQHP
ncbi:protein of unknown function [Geoalkalibacter ferrihydriticus]|uniref:Transmembrane protein n=1 Tax=Geoalkalibacter ferrihydriticus TaxID=392333 RepID=A0A1G9SQW9_9BACT|nr:YfiR family protein [Geoalkalibacter ferrihydriticus]SDM37822.1 protein of unknown function [Geoalkalibacter ferrihydriticus]